ELGLVALRREPHLGAALGEAGGAALAFEGDGVGLGRLHVRERELALELGAHWADARHHQHLVLVLAARLDRLTSRHARLEHRRIIERVPYDSLRRGHELLAGHFHARFSRIGWLRVLASSTRLFRLCTGRKTSTCGSI